jgi:tRNA (guanine-N7-)-methyltransferase
MRAKDSRPDNLRFLIGDARNASDWFLPHSVDCIYLNFSDPWPKKGYAKRRLTYQSFLEQYRNLLKEGGLLRLKTDNEGLFLFSLEQFELCGLTVEWKTNDLHASEKAEGNIMTEYERNFSEKGQPIYSAWVRF